jgi:hypothetical protein
MGMVEAEFKEEMVHRARTLCRSHITPLWHTTLKMGMEIFELQWPVREIKG